MKLYLWAQEQRTSRWREICAQLPPCSSYRISSHSSSAGDHFSFLMFGLTCNPKQTWSEHPCQFEQPRTRSTWLQMVEFGHHLCSWRYSRCKFRAEMQVILSFRDHKPCSPCGIMPCDPCGMNPHTMWSTSILILQQACTLRANRMDGCG